MNGTSKFLLVLLGIFTGIMLVGLIGVGQFYFRARAAAYAPTASPTATKTSIPPTQTATLTPNPAESEDKIEKIFEQAETALENYDLELAENSIEPLSYLNLTDEQLARFNGFNGMLELYKGHSRMACSYFEKQYALDRSADNLYITAQTCYAAGDTQKAFDYFVELQNWEGIEGNQYRIEAGNMIDDISTSLGIQTDTPQPTNSPAPTPTQKICQIPQDNQDAIPASYENGTGEVEIQPRETLFFHFAPSEPINVSSVSYLNFQFMFKVGSASRDVELGIYSCQGGWNWYSPNTGNYPVEDESYYITSTGDLYFILKNNDTTNIASIDHAGFNGKVDLVDGSSYFFDETME